MSLNRREFVQMGAAALAAFGLPTAAFARPGDPAAVGDPPGGKRKPNLVYIFADQMRADAMSCAGGTTIQTPHLDALAAAGVMATNALSTCPLCTPYRGMLMTGRHPHQTGLVKNDERLGDDETVIAEVMQAGGYTTGYIGKWHLSGNRKDPVDAKNRRGWDFWAVRNCSHDHFETEYWLNDARQPVVVAGWEPDIQTDLAIEFIKQRKDAPFCLFLSFGPPHNPYGAPKQYLAKCKNPYYAAVLGLDDCVGRIDAAIQAAGIGDDTILVFTSDHGDLLKEHPTVLGYKRGGFKLQPYRGSADVPFLIRWPGELPAGRTYPEPMATVDLMPTLLGLCGLAIPNRVAGKDISTALRTGKGGRQEVLMASYDRFIKKTTLLSVRWRALRTGRWLYAYHEDGEWMLYDLEKDPQEQDNLVEDPAHAAVRADLRRRCDAIRKEIGDTTWDGLPEGAPRKKKG